MDDCAVTNATRLNQDHLDMATEHQRSVVQVVFLLAMPVGLIVVDLDFFKAVNDTHGQCWRYGTLRRC